ncbi:hypothetical protein G5V57_07040 [Nordella sp. HKS 07]|uniref:hypothetical protein n=1 Tax=Nordella sp. HKS 07 TaxID=2712222 RepID=UPI0013E1B049|nr:hypothetical protein [Nordella sp. HKS 07]QIG47503.1 hypothetical protein G5V57_07040 [Nordella sp. HKS 07]
MNISTRLRDAIRTILDDVKNNHGILDVYKAAQTLQRDHPDEKVALEDIVAAIMAGRGCVRAIEFNPQTP